MLKGLRLEEIGQLLESFGFKASQIGEGFEDILLSLMKELELQPSVEGRSDGGGSVPRAAEGELLPGIDPSKEDLLEKLGSKN